MIKNRLVQSFSLARSGVYFFESIPFIFLNRWFTHRELPPPSNTQLSSALKKIRELFEKEAQNVEEGHYPLSVVEIENPWRHTRDFLNILADGVRVALRMRQNRTKDFTGKSEELKKDLPEYYARNFHFQTDGYLSEASARRYDHQVEILFSGTAGAMRRLILPPLKRFADRQGRWLELACGTGSATKSVLETFPQAKVTALDLSRPYLKIAQENLRKYDHVDFVNGDATALDFRDSTFDVVYSVYLFHELPRKEREQVVREAFRVLKPGGLLVFADSLQSGDDPDLEWALERFPKVYHEPFYKDYMNDKLEALVGRLTETQPEHDQGFFTKVVWAKKTLAPASDV